MPYCLKIIVVFRNREDHRARSKNSRGSIGRSQNSYNSLAKSSSGSSMNRYNNRPNSNQQEYGADDDPDQWITKYEQEMSTLQPRDIQNIPKNDSAPEIQLVPGNHKSKKNYIQN